MIDGIGWGAKSFNGGMKSVESFTIKIYRSILGFKCLSRLRGEMWAVRGVACIGEVLTDEMVLRSDRHYSVRDFLDRSMRVSVSLK